MKESNISIGKIYFYKGKEFTMKPKVQPLFIAESGVLCKILYPESWGLCLKEELLSFDYFNQYQLRQ